MKKPSHRFTSFLALGTMPIPNKSTQGRSPRAVLAGAIVPLIALAVPAHAATVTWLGTSDATWSNDSNWNPGPTPVSGDTAVFNNAGNGNILLSLTTGTLTSILFDTSSAAAYTLGATVGADTLKLDNGGSITMNSTVTAAQTINSNLILGNDGSAQTFTLTNSSTSAALTVAGGIAGSDGAGLKTLAVAGSGNATLSGVISNGSAGTVGLSKTGAGTLTLTEASTFSGETVVNGGTLVLAGTSSTNPAIRGTVTVNSGATLNVAGAAWVGFGNGGAKITTVNVNGATVSSTTNSCFITGATVNLTSGTWSGGDFHWVNTAINSLAASGTSVISGNILIRPDYGYPTVNIDVADGSAATDLLISGVIKQTDALHIGYVVKTGSGTLTLSNNCSYTGTTTVSGGTLQLGNGAGAGSVAGDILDNSALIFNRSDTSTYAGAVSGAGSVSKVGAGTIILTGTQSYSGGTTISAGGLQLGNGCATGMISGNVVDNGSLAFNRSDAIGYSGTISGTGSVTKSGSGSLALNASNTYTGGTTLSTGTLIINNGAAGVSASSAIGTGTLTIAGGALDSTVAGVTLGGNNPQAWNGDFTFLGSQSLDMGKGTVTLGSARQVTVNAGNLTVGGVSGLYLLTKSGAGTLTLSGNSTNNGATISAGTLASTGTYTPGGAITLTNGANAASLFVAGKGFLNWGGQTVNIGGNTGAATVSLQESGSMSGSTNLTMGSNSRLNMSGSAQLIVNANTSMSVGGSSGALVNQSGGSVTVATTLFVGTTGTTSGSYLMTGGTLTLLGSNTPRFNIARPQNGSVGVFQMTGGTFATTGGSGWLWGINDAPSSSAAGYGTLYAAGGAITLATGINIDVGPRQGQGDLTVAGASISVANGSVLVGNEGGSTGIFSLNGGTVQANAATKSGATGYLNFAGGTLKANTANATFISAFDRATVYGAYTSGAVSYAGGATIDTNGVALTVPQNLLAPSGSGVAVSSTFSTITGLTGIPFVRVTGGGGSGATAQAIFDPVTNAMSGIVITNPGNDYTSNPTFNVFGGGITGTTTITGTTASYTSGGLTKTGAGMLTLTGANTYTGLTTVSSGTLQIGNGTTDGTLASSGIANGGVVVFSNTGTRSFSGVISGTGSFVKQSAGTLTLSGSNSYTGNTTLGGGILVASSATAFGSGGNIAFTGGTLQLTSASAGQDFSARIKNSTSAIVLDTNGQNAGFSGSIDGSNTGGLIKSGLGALSLSASNAYSGMTVVNAGSVSFRTQSALYSGTSSTWTPSNITVAGGAVLALGVGDSASGYFDNTAVTTLLDGSHMGLSASITGFKSGAVLAFDPTNATGSVFTYSTPFSGIGTSGSIGLGIIGSGTLILGASNSYTGPTIINGGVLVPNDANALSTGNIMFGGGTLQYTSAISGSDLSNRIKNSTGAISIDTNGQNVVFANPLNNTNTGGLAKAGGGTLTITGSNNFTGGATVTGGALTISSTNGTGVGGTINVSNSVLNLGVLAFNAASTVAISNGLITNQASSAFFFQNGSLTLTSGTWSGTQTHLVNTPVNVLASSGTSVITPDLMARPDFGAPSLNFNVADGPSPIDLLVSGVITQSNSGGYFVKNGSGTMVFTGWIGTSGTTAINAGTLQVGNGGTAGWIYNSSPVVNNGTLAFNRSNTAVQGTDLPTVITGSGNLVQTGAGSLILNGSNNYMGTTFINNGVLTASNAYAMGSVGNITFGGGALQYTGTTAGIDWTPRIKNSTGSVSLDTNGQNITLAGNIDSSNTGGIAKSGNGSLTLTGSIGCTGTTTVTGGTLTFSGAALPTSAWNIAGAGAVLDLSALTSGTLAPISLAGTSGTLSLGANRLVMGSDGLNATFGASISGSGGFTKSGAGTLTLTAPNRFAGGATISSGTVILSNNGTLGNGPIDVGSNTLVINRGDFYGGSTAATTPTITIGAGGVLTNSGSNYNTLVNVNLNGGTITATGGYDPTWLSWGLASSGTLTVGGTSQSVISSAGTSTGVLVNNNTFNVGDVTAGADLLVATKLASTSATGFTKTGAGTMLLTGSNTFTGTVTINAGTLQIGDGVSGSIPSTAAIGIYSGGTLALDLANSASLGNAITNAAGGTLNMIGSGTTTISGTINGPGTFNQNGSGMTILSGVVSSYGTINDNAGTLQLSGTYAAFLSTVNVAANNSLTFGVNATTIGGLTGNGGFSLVTASGSAVNLSVGNNNFDCTFSGVISGNDPTSVLTKIGTGKLTLTGSNTCTGTIMINGGTLQVPTSSVMASTSGISLNGAGSTLAVNFGGAGDFTVADVTLLLAKTTFNSTSTAIALDTANLSGTFGGNLAMTGGLTKLGANTLTLTGSNTYSGNTTVSGGTLLIASSGQLSGNSLTINSGATVSFSGDFGYTAKAFRYMDVSGAGLTINGGTLQHTGASNAKNGQPGAGRMLTIGANGATIDSATAGQEFSIGYRYDYNGGKFVSTSGGNLTLAGVGNGDLNASLPGSGGLIKSGSGTWKLTGTANSYTGTTIIGGGVLQANHATALGNGGYITFGGGTLQYTSLSAGQDWSTRFMNSGSAISLDTNGQNVTFSGAIDSSNNGGLTKSGSGMLTLSGNNAYSGPTTVNSGTLQLAANNSAGATGGISVNNAGTTLLVNYGGSSEYTDSGLSALLTNTTFGAVGTVLAFDTTTQSGTYGGSLSTPASFIKQGANTLTLTGSNGFTGSAIIKAGTLQIGDGATGGVLSASSGIVNNGALVYNVVGNQSYGSVISGTGSLTKTGAGNLTFTGVNTYTGGTTLSDGILQLGNSNALGTGGLIVNGGTLDLDGNSVSVPAFSGTGGNVTNSGSGTSTLTTTVSGTSTYAGNIADAAGGVALTKEGAGKLILSGSLTMFGLNANAGVTELAQSGSIGAVTVSGSGTVLLTAHTGAYKVLETSSLSITTGGNIDIWNNAMILRASGTTENAANLATVKAAVNSASNGLRWNGVGIGSTTAFNEAQPEHTQALALMVYDNTVIKQGSFEGVSGLGYFDESSNPVGFNQVLVKLTYLGDFNADGVINASDYTWLDGFALGGNALGDLNGDGVVNATDYTWLDGSALNQSFGILAEQQGGGNSPTQLSALANSITASPEAVPEPGSFGLLLLGSASMMGIRRLRKVRR